MNWWAWIEDIPRDIQFSVRLLLKERWFTLGAIAALGLGFAVTAMMVTIINGYNFRGLPVGDPERILALGTHDITGRSYGVSYPDYQDWRRAVRSFAALEAYAPVQMTIGDKEQSPETASGVYVSAGAFGLLGVHPILGRGFHAADDHPNAPPVVILGHQLWESRYGRDPEVIGRTVVVNATPATVIGVMAEAFEFPFRHALWQPLALMPGLANQARDERTLGVFGRLNDGVQRVEARAELAAIAAALARDYPQTNAGIAPTAVRFGEQQVGRFGDSLPPLALAATALFVLLIACANVANLLLARSAARAREMAIRAAVGATRGRIVRQLLVENIVLAVAAAALGVWLSTFGVRFVSEGFGRNVPYWMRFTLDVRVLLVLIALCFLSTLLFGLAPALFASRTNVGDAMKEGGRAGTPPRVRRWTETLLAAELAVTLVLLAGGALMLRSFVALYRADRVIDPSHVLTMKLELPAAKYAAPQQQRDFYERLDERLRTISTLPYVTVASTRPFIGGLTRLLSFEGRPNPDSARLRSVTTVAVGPRYFDTLQVRLLQGRRFAAGDGLPGREVAIVNQRFAETYYPAENPLGQRITLIDRGTDNGSAPWFTIVGVSPTIRQAVASAGRPVVYVPIGSHSGVEAAIMAGGLRNPAAVTPQLRREVAALDPDVMLFNVRPLTDLQSDSRLQHRLMGTLLAVFAGIALLLSTIGVYSVTAWAVLQRTHEIGVRIALGANSRQVVWLFVRRGLVPLAIGLLAGAGGALAVGKLLQGLLVQTSATDPVTLAFIVTLLVTAAVAACFLPARRAAALDPLVILRSE